MVGPPTLLGQWYDECQKFAPALRVATYHSMDATSRHELATNQLQHYTFLFQTFMLMNLFNMVNCRALPTEEDP